MLVRYLGSPRRLCVSRGLRYSTWVPRAFQIAAVKTKKQEKPAKAEEYVKHVKPSWPVKIAGLVDRKTVEQILKDTEPPHFPQVFVDLAKSGAMIDDLPLLEKRVKETLRSGSPELHHIIFKGRPCDKGKDPWEELHTPLSRADRVFVSACYSTWMFWQIQAWYLFIGDFDKVEEYCGLMGDKESATEMRLIAALESGKEHILSECKTIEQIAASLKTFLNKYPIKREYCFKARAAVRSYLVHELIVHNASPKVMLQAYVMLFDVQKAAQSSGLEKCLNADNEYVQAPCDVEGCTNAPFCTLVTVYDAILSRNPTRDVVLELLDGLSAAEEPVGVILASFVAYAAKLQVSDPETAGVITEKIDSYRDSDTLVHVKDVDSLVETVLQYYKKDCDGVLRFFSSSWVDPKVLRRLSHTLQRQLFELSSTASYRKRLADVLVSANVALNTGSEYWEGGRGSDLDYFHIKQILTQLPTSYSDEMAAKSAIPEQYLAIEAYALRYFSLNPASEQLPNHFAHVLYSRLEEGTLFEKPASGVLSDLVKSFEDTMAPFSGCEVAEKTVDRIHTQFVRSSLEGGVSPRTVVEYLCAYYPDFVPSAKALQLLKDAPSPASSRYAVNGRLPPGYLYVSIYKAILSREHSGKVVRRLLDAAVEGKSNFVDVTARSVADCFAAYAKSWPGDKHIGQKILELRRAARSGQLETPVNKIRALLRQPEITFDQFRKFVQENPCLNGHGDIGVNASSRVLEIAPKEKVAEIFVEMIQAGYRMYSRELDKPLHDALLGKDSRLVYGILRGHFPARGEDCERGILQKLSSSECSVLSTCYRRGVIYDIVMHYWIPQRNFDKASEYIDLYVKMVEQSGMSKKEKARGLSSSREMQLLRDVSSELLDFVEEQDDLEGIVKELQTRISAYNLDNISSWMGFELHSRVLSRLIHKPVQLLVSYVMMFFPLNNREFQRLGLLDILDIKPVSIRAATEQLVTVNSLILPQTLIRGWTLASIYREVFATVSPDEEQTLHLWSKYAQSPTLSMSNPGSNRKLNGSLVIHRFLAFAVTTQYSHVVCRIYDDIVEKKIDYDGMERLQCSVLEALLTLNPEMLVTNLDEFKEKRPGMKIYYKTYATIIKKFSMDGRSEDAFKVYLMFKKDFPALTPENDSHGLLALADRFQWRRNKDFTKHKEKDEVKVKVDRFNVRLYDYDHLGKN